jgi:hypothetical protein
MDLTGVDLALGEDLSAWGGLLLGPFSDWADLTCSVVTAVSASGHVGKHSLLVVID